MHKKKKKIYERFIKRLFDFFISLVAIIFLSPLFLIIMILIKYKIGSPIIFKQKRAGRNEKEFILYKFRTMTDKRDQNDNLLSDVDRLTKFGQRLRTLSLDELPELFNILKGDMSFVGPRPFPTNYLPYYKEHERKRHIVRSGLTGLAQIKGRNSLSWEERFKFDIDYVNNITFFGDIRIILQTALKVIKRDDIGIRGISTPPDFHIYRKNILNNIGSLECFDGGNDDTKKTFDA